MSRQPSRALKFPFSFSLESSSAFAADTISTRDDTFQVGNFSFPFCLAFLFSCPRNSSQFLHERESNLSRRKFDMDYDGYRLFLGHAGHTFVVGIFSFSVAIRQKCLYGFCCLFDRFSCGEENILNMEITRILMVFCS